MTGRPEDVMTKHGDHRLPRLPEIGRAMEGEAPPLPAASTDGTTGRGPVFESHLLHSLRASVTPCLAFLRPALITAAAGLLPAVGLVVAVAALGGPAAGAPSSAPVQLQAALRGDRSWSGETEAGNLIADALRAVTGTDIALVAAGEIREDTLPPGSVTTEQLQRLIANGSDTVTVLSLNGATLRQALEVAVSAYPRKSRGFLQVSGMEFTFDASRSEGSRIVSRTVGGQPMQDGRQYRVAMSSSLASGQYGYYRLWNREKGDAQGLTMAGALEQYLRDRKTLSPRLENRIVARPTAPAR